MPDDESFSKDEAETENKKRSLTEESEVRLKPQWQDQSMRFTSPDHGTWFVGERVKENDPKPGRNWFFGSGKSRGATEPKPGEK